MNSSENVGFETSEDIERLRCRVEAQYGPVKFSQSNFVQAQHFGERLWQGIVHTFSLENERKLRSIYVWTDTSGEYVVVRATTISMTPLDAVSAYLIAKRRSEVLAQNAADRMKQAEQDAKIARYWANAPKSAISGDVPLYPVDGRAAGILKSGKS
jgi:hypothetical protein